MSIKQTTLSNGLRVVSDFIPHVETVSLGIWVDVGTRHETKNINGIAHVLEHMAFKGTKTRSAVQIAQEIESVGGYLNAYTGREMTAYYARVLKNDSELAVDILADILQNSTFDANEFAREQGVIIQEIGQSNDTPDDIVFDYFQETCFPNQPMGWPTLGTVDVIQSLTPDVVKKYMHDHYGAKQMVFSAAGNIEHEKLVEYAKARFNNLPESCPKETVLSSYQGGDYRKQKDLEQVHILLGFESLPFGHDDYYALSIFSTLFGGGMSSRLFQEIREKRGLVYSIYSYAQSYADSGLFTIYAGTGEKEAAELLPVVCNEIKTVTNSLNEAEINRAKAQLKSSLLMGLESTSARCERLAHNFLRYNRYISADEMIQKINAVDAQKIKNTMQKIFSTKPTLTALGPVEHVMSYEKVIEAL